jgi:hypothetical protein
MSTDRGNKTIQTVSFIPSSLFIQNALTALFGTTALIQSLFKMQASFFAFLSMAVVVLGRTCSTPEVPTL